MLSPIEYKDMKTQPFILKPLGDFFNSGIGGMHIFYLSIPVIAKRMFSNLHMEQVFHLKINCEVHRVQLCNPCYFL